MLDYVGGDIGQIMADESQHVHSRSAYDMMDEYKIGELGGDEKIVSEGTFFYHIAIAVLTCRLGSKRRFPPGRDGCFGRLQPQQIPRSQQTASHAGLESKVHERVLSQSGAQPSTCKRASKAVW